MVPKYVPGAGLENIREEDLHSYFAGTMIPCFIGDKIHMRFCEYIREGSAKVLQVRGFSENYNSRHIPVEEIDWLYRPRYGVVRVVATKPASDVLEKNGIASQMCDWIRIMPVQSRHKGLSFEKLPRSNRNFLETACYNYGQNLTDLLDRCISGVDSVNGNRNAIVDLLDMSLEYRGVRVGTVDPETKAMVYKKPYAYLGGLLGYSVQSGL